MLEIRKLYANEFNVAPNDINILQYTDLFESNQTHKNENIN